MSKEVIAVMGAPVVAEKLALATGILPGHLLVEAPTTVAVHAVAGGNAQSLYALKNIATAGDVGDEYIAGETVSYGAFSAGSQVSALLAAGADAVAFGVPLWSAGDGTLRATASTAIDSIVGYAMEAVDNSGEATIARITIRIA